MVDITLCLTLKSGVLHASVQPFTKLAIYRHTIHERVACAAQTAATILYTFGQANNMLRETYWYHSLHTLWVASVLPVLFSYTACYL